MGCNQPNLRVSGAEGTGRYQGTGSSHERRYARRFTAGRGGGAGSSVPRPRSILAAPRRAAAHIRANFDTKMTRRVFGQVRPAAHRASCQVSILLRRQCIVMCASGGLRRNARPGAVCPMWAYSTRSHPKMAHLPCNAQTGAICPLSWQNHTFGLQVILPAGLGGQHAGLHCKC